jgi:hypothetical protein
MLELLPLYIDQTEKSEGTVLQEQKKAAKNKENVDAVLHALARIEEDGELKLGEKISEILTVMAKMYMRGTGNSLNLWKLDTTGGDPYYIIPSHFHRLVHEYYNNRLNEQKVFNAGTKLTLKAYALPCNDSASLDSEENVNSVLVQFRVKGYYPQLGYCYLRLDYQ